VLRSSRYIAIHALQVIVNFHGHRDQARICRRQGVFRALTVGTKVEPDCGDAPKSSGLLIGCDRMRRKSTISEQESSVGALSREPVISSKPAPRISKAHSPAVEHLAARC